MEFWRKCSTCKKPIGFRTKYWVCNVSTCNRKRTGLIFCTVSCWDAHNPMMNHRESWAEERMSPSEQEWEAEQQAVQASQVSTESASSPTTPQRALPQFQKGDRMENQTMTDTNTSNATNTGSDEKDVLVVASKLKNYIRARSGMNTSGAVMEALSERIRGLCDQAIENARREGRKTVMDRDFQ